MAGNWMLDKKRSIHGNVDSTIVWGPLEERLGGLTATELVNRNESFGEQDEDIWERISD